MIRIKFYVQFVTVLIFGILFSPLTSANESNTVTPLYSDLTAAFIAGVSLPTLCLLYRFSKRVRRSILVFSSVFISALILVFMIGHGQNNQSFIILISGVGLVTGMCFWHLVTFPPKRFENKVTSVLFGLAVLCAVSLWFFPHLNIFVLWLALTGAMISVTLLSNYSKSRPKYEQIRNIVSLVLIALFCVSLYLWSNINISNQTLLSAILILFCCVSLNNVYSLINRFLELNDNSATRKYPITENFIQDPVTNLPTMQRGIDVLKRFVNMNSAENAIVIAFKPLNFDQVNKVLGHQNSDLLLLQFAYKLQKSISNNPLLVDFGLPEQSIKLCRIHGLDFMFVIDKRQFEHPEKIVVEDLCQQLVTNVPKAMSFKSFSLNFELAFGICLGQQHHEPQKMVSEASDALLLAERTNQLFCYFDHKTVLYSERQLANMEKLKVFINEGQVRSLAQPQVSQLDNKIIGFVMSIDWHNNFGSSISRDEFEEISEYSGVLYQLTKQLISDAFRLLATVHQQGFLTTASINLSSKDLLEPELTDFIEKEAENYQIDLSYLIVELNEKVLLSSAFRARMMIDQLRSLGVKIAVDEFSGSYEALKYLRKASVQQVKIDCQHIGDKEAYKADKTIVNALINLIRKMKIPVVGTGIDTLKTNENYLSISGDFAQGKLIHSGLPLEQITSWLERFKNNSEQA